MEVIYRLIPGMILIGLILVGILIWAIKRGQYDDLEGDAHRILLDEDDEMMGGEKRGDRRNWPDAEDDGDGGD
ncbi:MAG: cbb3-type cytochrome oxidase assembly protein CcoS [Gammaproteobacteria bacterium]|nr:cbb3-type cytochrome oxidase assembly protein CcoS [Gammaproteobacteria bacterium]